MEPTGHDTMRPSPAFHSMMLLSDSALPLGSFAFSSGLESCLAHQKTAARPTAGVTVFKNFLDISVHSVASALLPFVHAAHQRPTALLELDNDLDAATPCGVAKRASVAQGRALVAMWDRSFKAHVQSTSDASRDAIAALNEFSTVIKAEFADEASIFGYSASGHLPPLFGVLAAAMGLSLAETLYMFLLNHAKTLLSAGIRASVLGPYQSQALLASQWLRDLVQLTVDDQMARPIPVEDAGQCIPALDIWSGRHDIVYSRIFNS